MSPARALFFTRLLHTVIWAVMAASILALPVLAVAGRFAWAWAVTLLMALEGVALGLSGGECPLTGVARRYTDEDGPAFDIFLPAFIAKWNKQIFGALFVLGEVMVVRSLLAADRTNAFHYLAAICFGCAATALAFLWHTARHVRPTPRSVIVEAVGASGLFAAGMLFVQSA